MATKPSQQPMKTRRPVSDEVVASTQDENKLPKAKYDKLPKTTEARVRIMPVGSVK